MNHYSSQLWFNILYYGSFHFHDTEYVLYFHSGWLKNFIPMLNSVMPVWRSLFLLVLLCIFVKAFYESLCAYDACHCVESAFLLGKMSKAEQLAQSFCALLSYYFRLHPWLP